MADVTVLAPARWLPRRHRRALISIAILMFFGFVSWSAYLAMKVDCRQELVETPIVLTGGGKLLTGGKSLIVEGPRRSVEQQCEVAFGKVRLPLPALVHPFLFRFLTPAQLRPH